MIVRKEIDLDKPLTAQQKRMLAAMEAQPAQPDADCPELTPEQLNEMTRVAEIRRKERKKQTIALRLSPQALRVAKSLGKGYTAVLSRIIESTLADSEAIKRYL